MSLTGINGYYRARKSNKGHKAESDFGRIFNLAVPFEIQPKIKIMKFFSRLFGFIVPLLMLALDFVKQNVVPATTVCDILKSVIASPNADLLVELTKTKWDDAILAKVRSILGTYATDCGIEPTESKPNDLITPLVAYMRQLSPLEQSEWIRTIGTRLANEIQTHNHPLYVVDTMTQLYYAAQKENLNLSRFRG